MTIYDIFDKASITNSWYLHGSTKENLSDNPYIIHYRYDSNNNELDRDEISNQDLVKKFSLKSKNIEISIKSEYQKDQSNKSHFVISNNSNKPMNNYKKNGIPSNYEDVCNLLDVISVKDRVNDYNKWMELGWCLHNIDEKYIDTWIAASKLSPKFTSEKDCHSLWNKMNNSGLTIKSLYYWAKKDNKEGYCKFISNKINPFIKETLKGSDKSAGTNYDVAKLIFEMYKYDYKCTDPSKQSWYVFLPKLHKWRLSIKGHDLRKKLSEEVVHEYLKYNSALSQSNLNSDVEDSNIEDDIKTIAAVMKNLKKTTFKKNIMEECSHLFFDEDFEQNKDKNAHLLGFTNGVYDLKNGFLEREDLKIIILCQQGLNIKNSMRVIRIQNLS